MNFDARASSASSFSAAEKTLLESMAMLQVANTKLQWSEFSRVTPPSRATSGSLQLSLQSSVTPPRPSQLLRLCCLLYRARHPTADRTSIRRSSTSAEGTRPTSCETATHNKDTYTGKTDEQPREAVNINNQATRQADYRELGSTPRAVDR